MIKKHFKVRVDGHPTEDAEMAGASKYDVRSRKAPHIPLMDLDGIDNGDGGPYFCANKNNVQHDQFILSKQSVFFDFYTDVETKESKLYWQHRTVKSKPPPRRRTQGISPVIVKKVTQVTKPQGLI